MDFSGGSGNSHLYFLTKGWKSNREIIEDKEYYRLLTSTFLHADPFHLFLNMFFLFQVGRSIVFIYDIPWFLIIYLLSGIGGSLASLKFNSMPSVGASGALFGLLGALLVFYVLTGSVTGIMSVIVTLAINYIFGKVNKQIDQWGHIGGFVAGVLVSLVVVIIEFGYLLS
jgi:rhomboid protease GluP